MNASRWIVTLHRLVQRCTPLLIDTARPCRHAVGRRWFVDETYVKVAGVWRYVYRDVDGYGEVIDVYVSVRRDIVVFIQNLCGGHDELGIDTRADQLRCAAAFDELNSMI